VKRAIFITLGVLVLAAIVAAGVLRNRGEKGEKVYAEEAKKQGLTQVVKASGEIDPRVKVNISAHVIGKIDRLFVEEGKRIEKGQPFLQLEREAFTAQRDQWAAQLRKAETEVRQARVSLADARNKLQRAERLQAEGIFTAEQLEAGELAEGSAKVRVEDARESVQQARANLEKAEDDLRKTTIYAPISGRVIDLNAEEGEVVVSGTMNNPASVIGVIADLSEILANVDVDETEIVHVRPGQPAVVKVDALPDREYRGQVVEVGSSGFNRAQQPDVTFFDVEILLEDPDEALRPGMSVRAEIAVEEQPETVAVPIQSVVERQPVDPEGKDRAEDRDEEGIDVVFVIEDGKAVQRPVETGISDETHVEIVSGLEPGERVVTGPYRTLRDLKHGETVHVEKPSAGGERRGRGGERDEDDEEEER
jgi:HlyD family secretion protein